MTRSVDNVGVGGLYASFAIDQMGGEYDLTVENEGQAVGLSGSNEVDLGSDGDAFLGRLESVDGDLAVVQIGGVVRAPYDDAAAPSVGGTVELNGAGKVKTSTGGRGLVLAVDAVAETCDVLL